METPTLSVKDKEEKAQKCEFVQGLLLSTMLDDDNLWREFITKASAEAGLSSKMPATYGLSSDIVYVFGQSGIISSIKWM